MDEKRYAVHDFLIGDPVLIDRVKNTMTFYKRNFSGQIYNLNNPESRVISTRRIHGLIERTQNGSYSFANSFVADGYIYKYIMTPEQQAMCGRKPDIPGYSALIIQTNDYAEAIRTMCEWVYEHEYRGDLGNKETERGRLLKYCGDFLSGRQAAAMPEKQAPSAVVPERKTHDRDDR